MSWQSKILSSDGKLIYVTDDSERKAFYYLLVSESNKRKFFNDLKEKSNITFTDYGTVVLSGWGEPTDDDKKNIREKYNANI